MTPLLNILVFFMFLSSSKNELIISGRPDVGRIGEGYTIKCIDKSNKGTSVRITWRRNKSLIAIISTRQCQLLEELKPRLYTYECNIDNNTYDLKIPREYMTEDEDNTVWSCSDDNQRHSDIFRLDVIGIKEFKEFDITLYKKINVNESESIILRCGNRMESPTWNRTYIKQSKMIYGQETYLLNYTKTLIHNASCFDTGLYKCNDWTMDNRSNSARIVVLCIPTVSKTSETNNICDIGEKLHLFAFVLAYPKPTIAWTFKPKGLGDKPSITSDRRVSIQTNEIDSFLQFTELSKYPVNIDDFGEYELRLENAKGFMVKLFKVEQNGTNVGHEIVTVTTRTAVYVKVSGPTRDPSQARNQNGTDNISVSRTITLTEAAILAGGIGAVAVLVVTVVVIIFVIRRKKGNDCNLPSNSTRHNGNVRRRNGNNLNKRKPVLQNRMSETNNQTNDAEFNPPHYIYIDDNDIVSIPSICNRALNSTLKSVSDINDVTENSRRKPKTLEIQKSVPQTRHSEKSSSIESVDFEPYHYAYINDNEILPIVSNPQLGSYKENITNPSAISSAPVYPLMDQKQIHPVSHMCHTSVGRNISRKAENSRDPDDDGLNQAFQLKENIDHYDDFTLENMDSECTQEKDSAHRIPLVDMDGYLVAVAQCDSSNASN